MSIMQFGTALPKTILFQFQQNKTMSLDATLEKASTSLHKSSTLISQKNDNSNFTQKLKDIKQLLRQLISEDKLIDVEAQLDQLQEIYNTDVGKDKGGKPKQDEEKPNKRNEKIILQTLEGKKITNDIRLEPQIRHPRSPEKKVEQKKFVKFEPKKLSNPNPTNLVSIRKTSPTK